MKNIHILPTDQPSRLVKIKDTFFTTSSVDIPGGTFYNIYITSSERIKASDWFIFKDYNTYLFQSIGDTDDTHIKVASDNEYGYGDWNKEYCRKIILTTDQDLIADGVQAIDDEFLLWFVKNSSCEFVVIDWSPLSKNLYGWKIIIPQEEPKEEIQMYSEGEVYELLCHFFDDHVNAQDANIAKWFEKNKK